MRRSTDRILTTHVGSLPRPASLLDLMKTGEQRHELDSAVTRAVDAAVRQQIAHGADGEQGKGSFFTYVAERLTGFEPRPGARAELWSAEVGAFPEYYAEYFRQAMMGGSVVTLEPLVCVGPVTYRRQAAIARDIGALNFTSSSAGTRPRSFTSMPWALAHSRTSVVFSPLAAPRRALRAGRRVAPPTRRAAPA
jgi:5-methyltetrahydropteroyltriglutamate--homocysteine methyltransferase